MSEQLNQMQSVLEQLVKMVGHNNAVTEEIRQDNVAIRAELAATKAELKSDINEAIRIQQHDLYRLLELMHDKMATKESLAAVEAKIDRMTAIQTTQGESINLLAMKQFQTEVEVSQLKKAQNL